MAKIIPLGLDGHEGVQIIFVVPQQKRLVIEVLGASNIFDQHVRQMRTRADGVEALCLNNALDRPETVKALLENAGVPIEMIIR